MTKANVSKLKEKLLGLKDYELKQVDFKGVTGWEEITDVYVKTMNAKDQMAFHRSLYTVKPDGSLEINQFIDRTRRALYQACDVDGNRIFDEAEYEQLADKSHQAMERIVVTAIELEAKETAENPIS